MLRGLDLKYRILERKTYTEDELHMYELWESLNKQLIAIDNVYI